MPEQANREDEWGRPIVYASPRPPDTTTFFAGAGDSSGVAKGNRLLFKLASTDSEKSIDLTFEEGLYLKDGHFTCEGAPFGAYLSAVLVHPVSGDELGSFARKVPVFGTWPIDLNTDDKSSIIPAGIILRVTVHNADGTGDQDLATDFKVAGRLEFFRATTV